MTPKDWLMESAASQRGLFGAKPPAFARWIIELLVAEPDDSIEDLFSGSGSVGAVFANGRLDL